MILILITGLNFVQNSKNNKYFEKTKLIKNFFVLKRH